MTAYRVEVAGRLPESAEVWLDDLPVAAVERTAATSSLTVLDQAALVGVVNRMHGLGIVIVRVAPA